MVNLAWSGVWGSVWLGDSERLGVPCAGHKHIPTLMMEMVAYIYGHTKKH